MAKVSLRKSVDNNRIFIFSFDIKFVIYTIPFRNLLRILT